MSKKIQKLDVSVLGQDWKIDLTDYVEMLEPNLPYSIQHNTLYLDEDTGVVTNNILKISPVFATVEGETLILNV